MQAFEDSLAGARIVWGRRPAFRVASGFRLEARLREKFRWKPSDLQNTRHPAFLGTARLDTVDEELTADTLKPGASVEGDAMYGASLVRLSDRCK